MLTGSLFNARTIIGLCSCLTFAPHLAQAQGETELAKQTQNPVASLISVPIQANWDSGIGDRQTTGTLVNIQPVMPFGLTKKWNAIVRVVTPLASQPAAGDARFSGVGDTLATMFLSPVTGPRFIWGVGPVLLLPTATTDGLGSEKIGLGPSVVALTQPGRVTLGVLFNQIWSVSGANDRPDVSQMLLQPFANYNLGSGLSVGMVAEANANRKSEACRLPVAGCRLPGKYVERPTARHCEQGRASWTKAGQPASRSRTLPRRSRART